MNPVVQQYEWVRQTREALFEYCESLQQTDYVKEVAAFGWGSVRNIQIHVADCYRHWLLGFARGQRIEDSPTHAYESAAHTRELFRAVDGIVHDFLADHESAMERPISGRVGQDGAPTELSPLWLISHTMTHEFHHKGQLVTLTRHLGYTPPDTDLVWPEHA